MNCPGRNVPTAALDRVTAELRTWYQMNPHSVSTRNVIIRSDASFATFRSFEDLTRTRESN